MEFFQFSIKKIQVVKQINTTTTNYYIKILDLLTF